MKNYSQQELMALQNDLNDWIMSHPGVTGTSIGLGKGGDVTLRVFTHHISDETRQAIQDRLPADAPLEWDEGEEIIAYPASAVGLSS